MMNTLQILYYLKQYIDILLSYADSELSSLACHALIKKFKMYIKNSDHQTFNAFLYNDIKLHVLVDIYTLSP